jgi:head-tail adaptor
MMRAGRLDRLVTIQRRSLTLSDSGEPVETWTVIASRWPASVRPAAGSERFSVPVKVAEETVEFQIRWSSAVADLQPQDQVIYPALAEASPEDVPDTRNIYDILAAHEIGRREGVQIIAKRRADVSIGS